MILDYFNGLFEASGHFLVYALPIVAVWWLFNRLRELKNEGFLRIFLISAFIYGGLGLYGTYWLHSNDFAHPMWNLGFWSVVYLIYALRATGNTAKNEDEDD